MGHFALRNKPAPAIPQTVQLGIRLKRIPPPPPDPPPPCVPVFTGWDITFDYGVADPPYTGDWQAFINPSPGAELCGGCLEWSYVGPSQISGATGAAPTVSIASAPDCVGLIVTIAGQDPIPLLWEMTFRATLNGQPFGHDAVFAVIDVSPPCVDACPGYVVNILDGTTQYAHPIISYSELDNAISFEVYLLDIVEMSDLCNGDLTFLWNITDPGGLVTAFGDSSNGGGSLTAPVPRIVFIFDGTLTAGATVTIAPTLDGVAFCDPLTVQPF